MTLEDLKFQIEDLVATYGEAILKKDVFASCDYGDYGHTQQLIRLESPRVVESRESAYSVSRLAINENEDDENEFDDSDYEDNPNAVVVF